MTVDVYDPRYARQLTLRGFGLAGQQRLAAARVLIVGVGGLGSPAAMYLAAAGVGALTLVDSDVVDHTNLHRQLLFGTHDVGRQKLDAARARLHDINPDVDVSTVGVMLDASNALALVQTHDVVIDATDNFPARYAINDACVASGRPFVYGSVARFQAQLSVFATADGPCYRCLFPDPPATGSVPTCAEEGVLGVVPGVVGLYQATEVIKLITGIGTALIGQLLLLDLLTNDSQRIAIAKRHACSACGSERHQSRREPNSEPVHVAPPSTTSTSVSPTPDVSPRELATRIARGDTLVVLDVREHWEFETAHLPGSVLLPLSELAGSVHTLDRDSDYVVLCHHGMRSAMAVDWLRQQGFTRVSNLTGGIDAWSVTVDPALPRY